MNASLAEVLDFVKVVYGPPVPPEQEEVSRGISYPYPLPLSLSLSFCSYLFADRASQWVYSHSPAEAVAYPRKEPSPLEQPKVSICTLPRGQAVFALTRGAQMPRRRERDREGESTRRHEPRAHREKETREREAYLDEDQEVEVFQHIRSRAEVPSSTSTCTCTLKCGCTCTCACTCTLLHRTCAT